MVNSCQLWLVVPLYCRVMLLSRHARPVKPKAEVQVVDLSLIRHKRLMFDRKTPNQRFRVQTSVWPSFIQVPPDLTQCSAVTLGSLGFCDKVFRQHGKVLRKDMYATSLLVIFIHKNSYIFQLEVVYV